MKSVVAMKYLETKHPLDLISKIVEHNNKTFGYCMLDGDGLNPWGDRGMPDPEGLIKSQEQAKQCTVYIFGAEEPPLAEDYQPWEMLRDSKNNIVCVGFFEGDFSGIMKADSAHVAAFHAKEVLSRKLKMMLRAVKDNAEDLYEECKSEEFKAEITELFTAEGTIVLHFNNNHVLWFCNPPEHKIVNKFGIFSDLCGWKEPAAATASPSKGNDKLAALMAAAAAKKAPPSSVPAVPASKPATVPLPNTMPQGAPTTYQDILQTKTLRTLSEEKIAGMLKAGGRFRHLENWYADVGKSGWPANYDKAMMMDIWNEIKAGEKDGSWRTKMKKLPGILSWKDREDAKKEYEALKAKGWATDVGDETSTQTAVQASSKDSATKKVTTVEGTTISTESEFLPTLDERSVSYLKNFVDKYWDKNHQPLDRDPTKLKAFADKYPTFLQKAGITDWSDCFGLPLEAYQDLCKRHDIARLFMFGAMEEIEKLRKELKRGGTTHVSPAEMTAASLPGARKRA